jgi:hypothetical protein
MRTSITTGALLYRVDSPVQTMSIHKFLIGLFVALPVAAPRLPRKEEGGLQRFH